jgi:hypothetical protein
MSPSPSLGHGFIDSNRRQRPFPMAHSPRPSNRTAKPDRHPCNAWAVPHSCRRRRPMNGTEGVVAARIGRTTIVIDATVQRCDDKGHGRCAYEPMLHLGNSPRIDVKRATNGIVE